MSEEQDLTQEQTEKLLQFQDLTGIESMDQCCHTLEQHNWNIEVAEQDSLDEQKSVWSVFNPPPSLPLQVNTADPRIYSYVVSRPQPRGLLGWGYYLIMLPFRFTYYTILDIFRYVPLDLCVSRIVRLQSSNLGQNKFYALSMLTCQFVMRLNTLPELSFNTV